MQVAVLAHESFPDRAKTAVGLLRYGDHEVRALIDREHAGERVVDHLPDVQDAPIVASMADVPEVDALVIGIAPIGGAFDESWRPDVRTALERGCDVLSGLHDFLEDDEEFAELAEEHGGTLQDLRKPPADLTVAEGTAGEVEMLEQPVAGDDIAGLARVTEATPIPVCADESCQTAADVPRVADACDVVNAKLVKCGGPRAARRLVHTADAHGLATMLGCMVESNASLSAAVHLAPLFEFADLDGALLLETDPFTGVPREDAQFALQRVSSGTGARRR